MSKAKTKSKVKAPANKKAKTKAPAKAAKKASAKAAKKAPAKAVKKPAVKAKPSASGEWRADMLARLRQLIFQADPQMIEERKWIKPTKPLGVPLWSHDGMVATGEIYKNVVKITFAYGASLPDPKRLFNASLEGGTRRAIDIAEGGKIDEGAFKALIKAAVARNVAKAKR